MKPLYQSKTVWGVILAVAAYVFGRLQNNPPSTTAEWITLAVEAIGVLLGAIGLRDAIRKEAAK